MVFASEPKNLVGLVEKIAPFPPGHYYKDGVFVCYADMTRVDRPVYDDLDTICQKHPGKTHRPEWRSGLSPTQGGLPSQRRLDSSLVCAIAAKKSSKPIRHLCHRYGHRCHRPEVRPGGGRLHRQRPHRGHHHPGRCD